MHVEAQEGHCTALQADLVEVARELSHREREVEAVEKSTQMRKRCVPRLVSLVLRSQDLHAGSMREKQ